MDKKLLKKEAKIFLHDYLKDSLGVNEIKEKENLMHSGLTSIITMQISNQLRKFGMRIPFSKLALEPILSRWFSMIDEAEISVSSEKSNLHLDDKNEEFELTDVQYAYWSGRDENQPLGGVGCHAYIGLLVVDWRMGLCIIVPVPVAAIVILVARKAQENAEIANLEAKRAAYDGVQEFLETIQELKSASREEEYLKRLDKKLETVVKCSFKNELAPGAANTTAQFILRFGLVAVLLAGGYFVGNGSLAISTFILFLIIAGRVYDPFNACFMLLTEIFSAQVSIRRMKEIDTTPEQTGSNTCGNKGYDIEFKNVTFAYNDEVVLDNISFRAKQGQVTALVGPSGSGKSTAVKLAARFWDVDSGEILLGGVNVSSVEPETLFKNYSIVFQDVLLFDDTVMENIRLGRKDATDEEVMAAAKVAQCEEFIMRLPSGYQTNIGENGSALSGGERQRISIARALLKNAPIILLDEATASMDAESETLVQEALSALLENKTVMVIAHRMRTVANADKVVVLEKGHVKEEGTPEELLRLDGLYAHMVRLQSNGKY